MCHRNFKIKFVLENSDKDCSLEVSQNSAHFYTVFMGRNSRFRSLLYNPSSFQVFATNHDNFELTITFQTNIISFCGLLIHSPNVDNKENLP